MTIPLWRPLHHCTEAACHKRCERNRNVAERVGLPGWKAGFMLKIRKPAAYTPRGSGRARHSTGQPVAPN